MTNPLTAIKLSILHKYADNLSWSLLKANHLTMAALLNELQDRDNTINDLLHDRAMKIEIIENMTFTIESLKAEYGID